MLLDGVNVQSKSNVKYQGKKLHLRKIIVGLNLYAVKETNKNIN